VDSQCAEHPAAQYASGNADDEVDEPAEAAATHKFPGDKPGNKSDKYKPDKTHNNFNFNSNSLDMR